MPHRKTQSDSAGMLDGEVVQVLVGPKKRCFSIHKNLLCSTSQFFRESLDAIPADLRPSPVSSPASSPPPPPSKKNRRSGFHDWTVAAAAAAATASAAGDYHVRSSSCSAAMPQSPPPSPSRMSVLWFADESPDMFELFVLWLYHRRAFAALVDDAVTSILTAESETLDHATAEARLRGLHWAVVNLHLFAVAVGLPVLQDLAMDAIQDLYLRLDWDVSPRFLQFLYDQELQTSLRLRKWAVAMAAWTLATLSTTVAPLRCGGGSTAAKDSDGDDGVALQFHDLLEKYPDFCEDYAMHVSKMAESRLSLCVKNPQLRIPTNALRNEERHFGFRMCSFHSHRASVGQGRCPHDRITSTHSGISSSSRSSSGDDYLMMMADDASSINTATSASTTSTRASGANSARKMSLPPLPPMPLSPIMDDDDDSDDSMSQDEYDSDWIFNDLLLPSQLLPPDHGCAPESLTDRVRPDSQVFSLM